MVLFILSFRVSVRNLYAYLAEPKLNACTSFRVIPFQNIGATGKTAGSTFETAVDGCKDNLPIFISTVKTGRTKSDS